MPLIFADAGKTNIIQQVGGTNEVKQHLADMGFLPGEPVTVVSTAD